MAADMVTPVDEISGLPLPIAPRCEWLPLDKPNIADPHHAFHPEKDPRLKTVAGLALRNAQLQIIERGLHNGGPFSYHKFYNGPTLPDSEDDMFSRCVLACAEVAPEKVIDLNNGDPLERLITRDELEFFRTPNDVDATTDCGFSRYLTYRYSPIRDFFQDYTTKQNLDHINQNKIDEFLFTRNRSRKINLGHWLLFKSVEVASEGVQEKYITLRRAKLLHPNTPETPQRLINYKLGKRIKRSKMIPELEISLRNRYVA